MRALLLLVFACSAAQDVGAELGGTIGEGVLCPAELANCGHVYMCGEAELCVHDDQEITVIEAEHGTCAPTPRHQGLCFHCCGEGCPPTGCNAYQGCACPEED